MNDISTICNLKDDKSCAVTFTTDDALYRSCLFYRSKFEEYGLRGTVAITADFVCPSTNSDITENNGYGNWEQWKALVDKEYFDVANHTKSHPSLDKISAEQLEVEVNAARELLQAKFPGQKVLCMANPFVVTNDTIDAVIRQQHFSARNGQSGYNSLSPTMEEWYHLNYQIALSHLTAEDMNAWIDTAIDKQSWLIEMWHGVDGQGWEPPASAECDRHLEYLSNHLEKVWNGTMGEVTQYLWQKQHSSIKTMVQDASEIHVYLNTTLDASLFDYPLTLKTIVPPSWKWVRIFYGNRDEICPVTIKDGEGQIIYSAKPNSGKIVIKDME